MTSTPPWSLSVKRVGVTENNYTVQVDPDSNLASLYTQIEGVTGIKANQQRLIYRGRILATTEQTPTMEESGVTKKDPKIKDVIGLCDGQTIHLVPKPMVATERQEPNTHNLPAPTPSSLVAIAEPATPFAFSRFNNTTSPDATSPTASLLAAILGLHETDTYNGTQEPAPEDELPRLRFARRRRRPNHRLTEDDLLMPDPGSMEPVRQALLTLHTMLYYQNEGVPQWYKGQWMDVRDTVNQWLEATVVDIAAADNILPQQLRNAAYNSRPTEPTTDAAVSANDFEGRMRLLLEPCGDNHVGEWGHYRQRGNNQGIQLLLIHYNGWPHRWDEWIRSDSERIRPFRTRTRHAASSSTASPCPVSSFNAAPSTHMKNEIEHVDRSVLLPELQRIIGSVNNVILSTMGDYGMDVEQSVRDDNLPWIAERDDDNNSIVADESESLRGSEIEHALYNRRQLEQLAPLLDRLGRALTDAAPHIASFAATLPREISEEVPRWTPGASNVVIAGESEEFDENEESADRVGSENSMSLGTGMFSLLNGQTTNIVVPDTNTLLLNSERIEIDDMSDDTIVPNDVDNADFVSGMVNTVRAEHRSRRVNRLSPSSANTNDDGTNLFAAYLAANSLASEDGRSSNSNDATTGIPGLGRLLLQRQNEIGSGGIDIHIHAFVTGPGVDAGTGFAMLGDPRLNVLGGQTATRRTGFSGLSSLHHRNRSSFADFRATPVSLVNEEDLGIFEDLYSENPSPVDLQSGLLATERHPRDSRSFDPDNDSEIMSRLAINRARSVRAPRSRSPRRHQSMPHLGEQSPRRGGALSRIFRRALGRRSNSNLDRLDRPDT